MTKRETNNKVYKINQTHHLRFILKLASNPGIISVSLSDSMKTALNLHRRVRCEVLTAVCEGLGLLSSGTCHRALSLVEAYQRGRWASKQSYCVALKTESVFSSETPANVCQNRRFHTPEDGTLQLFVMLSTEHSKWTDFCVCWFRIPIW